MGRLLKVGGGSHEAQATDIPCHYVWMISDIKSALLGIFVVGLIGLSALIGASPRLSMSILPAFMVWYVGNLFTVCSDK